MSRGETTELYHWTVFYDSAVPGVFTYKYITTGAGGGSSGVNGGVASVGIQGLDANGVQVASQYSYKQAVITPGLTIRCDTTSGSGTCVTVS